ncbi:hypothetical protein DPMN_018980, partial [Dreissena polymorpha]
MIGRQATIVRKNVLIKFHEDWIIIATSSEKCHAPLRPCFKRNLTIFYLSPDIISTNILTKFHKHWTTNVTFSVITRKTGPPPGSHFHENWTINVTSRVLKRKTATTTGVLTRKNWHATWQPYIIRTNVLTKFHEDWTINLTFTVKTALPPGGHVFLPTGTIFELVKDFIGTHVLTKKTATSPGTQFHEDWTINVISKTTHKRRSQKLTMR